MVKSGEEVFAETIKSAMEKIKIDWEKSISPSKPAGDKVLLDRIESLTKSFRSTQSKGIADRQHRQVRSNIERRAELRDKTSVGMPNIANILAGGAESPMAGLGRMQKAATRPFKAVWDYKKAQGESSKFSGQMKDKFDQDPFYKMTDDEEDKADRLKETESGMKKRAGSGMGKNLMGKKMQGMIGKVGKFMESSKGQGMMAGGMMGTSILTMVIKKAMEASPMLQAMFKIMNTAMTLFLRPIGDFIGGMLKPIMLFFLREIAVPMLKKGKDFIKFGEAFGKNVLGFLLKPIETIQAAILGVFPFVSEDIKQLALKFDGIKEWMSEQKMNVLASQMGFDSRHELIGMLNKANIAHGGKSPKGGKGSTAPGEEGYDPVLMAQVEAEFGKGWVATLQETVAPLDRFRQLMTDVSDNTYTYVDAQMKLEGSGLAVAEGMGAIVGQFTAVSGATGKVVTAMTDLETQIKGGGTSTDGTGATTTTTTGDGTGTTTTGPIPGGELQGPALPHWSDISVYDTVGKMFAAASQQIMQKMQKTEKGTEEYDAALEEYTMLTGGPGGPGSKSLLEGITVRFGKMQAELDKALRIAEKEKEYREQFSITLVKGIWDITSLEKFQREQMNQEVVEMAEDVATTGAQLTKILEGIRNSAQGYRGSGGGGGIFTAGLEGLRAAGSLESYSKSVTKHGYAFQHGGMINEPIWGIGSSGRSYTFGEAGPEMVTPMGKGGGVGPVTINVNVDSINSDVDLEKIKPIVERALLEVHSRRGII